MKARLINNGSVLLITIFVVALLSAITIGILQVNTEEIQLMRNQIRAAEALATAEAGLNDAFAEIRADSTWTTGFTDKAFNDDSYTVTVTGSLPNRTITSTGTSSQGFVAKVEADITVGNSSPYLIAINNLRINE
jgi:Tfp pilus assembly protein PilX